jgi:hypothetical protein
VYLNVSHNRWPADLFLLNMEELIHKERVTSRNNSLSHKLNKLLIAEQTYHCYINARNNKIIFNPPNYEIIKLTQPFQSLAVSLRTTRLNIKKFYMVLALR